MFSEVNKCYFIIIASSLAKFKPNACAIILCGWEMTLWRGTLQARGPGCIYLPVFHLSSDTISF